MLILFSDYGGNGGREASSAVRLLLEKAVRRYWDMPMPELAYEEHGKPFFPQYPDRYFSLSHTKKYVLCAVSDSPVGADIETVRPVKDSLRRRVCTERELASLDFFELWTLKESYIKLFGKLCGKLRENEFLLENGRITAPSPGVHSRVYVPVDGWRAAVCSLGSSDLPEELECVCIY